MATFTRGFVNPAVNPVGVHATVLVVLIVLIILIILVGLVVLVIVALIVIGDVGNQALEICKGVASITMLPLTSFGWVSLDDIKCGHELCVKVWGSSEHTASDAMKETPVCSLLTCGLLDPLMVRLEHGVGHIECGGPRGFKGHLVGLGQIPQTFIPQNFILQNFIPQTFIP